MEDEMPADTVIVVAGVLAAFAFFTATLLFVDMGSAEK
jgi:hypothetical protein